MHIFKSFLRQKCKIMYRSCTHYYNRGFQCLLILFCYVLILSKLMCLLFLGILSALTSGHFIRQVSSSYCPVQGNVLTRLSIFHSAGTKNPKSKHPSQHNREAKTPPVSSQTTIYQISLFGIEAVVRSSYILPLLISIGLFPSFFFLTFLN